MIKNRFKKLLVLIFVTIFYSNFNVLVFRFYYLRKVYKNVYTADGQWFISLNKIIGYFNDNIGLVLSTINIGLILSIVVIALIDEFSDRKQLKLHEKEILKQIEKD